MLPACGAEGQPREALQGELLAGCICARASTMLWQAVAPGHRHQRCLAGRLVLAAWHSEAGPSSPPWTRQEDWGAPLPPHPQPCPPQQQPLSGPRCLPQRPPPLLADPLSAPLLSAVPRLPRPLCLHVPQQQAAPLLPLLLLLLLCYDFPPLRSQQPLCCVPPLLLGRPSLRFLLHPCRRQP